MLSSKRCSTLTGVLFSCCLLFPGTNALAQAYLYDYSYPKTGTSPLAAVIADINGDGRPDFATVDYDNTVSVVLAAPNAAYRSPVSYPTGASPFGLIAARLRGAKAPIDLITVNTPNGVDQPGIVSVLLGNGNGTFQSHIDYFVGDFPVGVVSGDFNHDGKVDLAIANEFDNNISILYGNGDGTFQPQTLVAVGSGPTSISTGDFNRDGKTDLIASCVGSGVVSVLINVGAGRFTRVDSSSGLFGPDKSLVITGKFTSAGEVDAVISSKIQEQIYFLKGQGDGSFLAPVAVEKTVVGEVYTLVAGDINHDGKTDLAFGSVAPTALSVAFGNGKGTFSVPVISPIFATESIAFADVNGDGFLDLVTPEDSLSAMAIVRGNGKGQFGKPKNIAISGTVYGPNATVVADFNGDGKLDLAIAETNFPAGQVAVALGTGTGTFGPALITPLLSQAINDGDLMRSGDFNGDGKTDLIMMDDYSTGFQVLLGKGDGTFQTAVDTKLNTSLNFAVGDFNRDGKTDVVVSTLSNGRSLISIYLSKGDGTFTLGAQYTETYGGPIVADVNRDGTPDLIFVGNPLFVMLGNGNGTFQSAITGPVLTTQSMPTINDFDGDGIPDVVVATFSGMAFLKGNGNGTFQSPRYSTFTTLFCCQLQAEDVNGDGKLDLINNDGQEVLAILGNGDGTFRLPFAYSANGQIYTGNIAIGDFNSDRIGDIGIVIEDQTSGKTEVSLYLSQATIAVFPKAINFGSVTVGQVSSAAQVHLSSAGNRSLLISGIQITGSFAEHNNCTAKLAIGASCTIQVIFEPQTTGVQKGTITIKDSALGGVQYITLSGIGR